MKFVSEKAVISEMVHPLREPRTKIHSKGNKCSKMSCKKPGGKTHGSGSSSQNKDKSTFSEGSKRTLPKCFNSECDKRHLVKDCHDTSTKLAKKLLEDRRKKRSGNKPSKISLLVCDNSETARAFQGLSDTFACNLSNSAAINAKIGGHTFACRIESGADIVAIPDPIANFRSDNGVYLPTIRPSNTKQVQAIDGGSFRCHSKVEISTILQIVAGLCHLRNLKAQIMPDQATYIKWGTVCLGEICLGSPFLILSALNIRDFATKSIKNLSSVYFGGIHAKETSTKVGKFGPKVISQQVVAGRFDSIDESHHSQSNQLCSMMVNGDFPLKDGADIDYKDVEVGEENTEELELAIQNMIS